MGRGGKREGAGRKKGVPNRSTEDAREILDRLHCDPIEGMARIALDEKKPIELRARIDSDLAQYRHPRLKAVELTGAGGESLLVGLINALAAAPNHDNEYAHLP